MANPQDSPDATDSGTPVLVSACLLGQACRHDGKGKLDAGLEQELSEQGLRAIALCPEERGGLATPRPKAWIADKNAAAVWAGEAEIVSVEGRQVTGEFKAGAELALQECRRHAIYTAYLKE
ncbi:MAG: DUF523 domain-containing protein, partial [bacterium]|nr:DUF523 domain-containing protein [bacterium]